MSEIDQLIREMKEIKSLLRQLIGSKKQTWVNVTVVKQVTGWEGREKLRWARESGLVTFHRKKGYLLESIPDVFIINPNQCEESAENPSA